MLNKTFLKFFITFAIIIGSSILLISVLNCFEGENSQIQNASPIE